MLAAEDFHESAQMWRRGRSSVGMLAQLPSLARSAAE
jgi:hypothetical protein